MAGKYNVQEMTAHYVAMAQNNPALFQQVREEILARFESYAHSQSTAYSTIENGHQVMHHERDDAADAMRSNVQTWFEQIAQTAQQMKAGGAPAAQASYNTACKTLSTAIKTSADKNAKSEDDHDAFNYSNYLEDVYSPDPEDEEGEEFEIEYQGKDVFRQLGPKRSAAEHIEEVRDRVKRAGEMTAEDIATVLAARQIADAIPGKRGRLDKTKINDVDLKERADKLMASQAFQDFLNEHKDPNYEDSYDIDPALLTDGHGGKLENYFSLSLKGRKDLQELPQDLYGRYQKTAQGQYTSYDAYIQANLKNYEQGGKKIDASDKETVSRAAHLLTAHELNRKNKAYNEAYLEKQAEKMAQSPQFRFMCKHEPEKLNLLTTGQFEQFGKSLCNHLKEASQMDAGKEDIGAKRKNFTQSLANGMLVGTPYGTVAQRQEKKEYNDRLKAFKDSYEFLGCKQDEPPRELTNLQDALDGYKSEDLNSLVNRANMAPKKDLSQDEVRNLYEKTQDMVRFLAAKGDDPTARKLSDELVNAMKTGSDSLNPPEFKDKKGKTAQKQLEEYKAKYASKFRGEVQKCYEHYLSAQAKDYNAKLKDAKAKLGATPSLMKYAPASNSDNSKGVGNNPEVYLSKRGPKYRAMVQAAQEYAGSFNFEKGNAADPAKTMKVIDAVLDYQNGKEKPMSGAAGDRFNNSMVLLASVTRGTPMEKYLDQQIKHINEVRGAQPGSKNYITKDMYFEGFEPNKQPGLQKQQEEPKAGGPQVG